MLVIITCKLLLVSSLACYKTGPAVRGSTTGLDEHLESQVHTCARCYFSPPTVIQPVSPKSYVSVFYTSRFREWASQTSKSPDSIFFLILECERIDTR